MATSSIPVAAIAPPHSPDAQNAAEMAAEKALVSNGHEGDEATYMDLAPAVSRLPVELDVSVPVRGFRVRNLLLLEPGQLLETEWGHGEDVPLAAGAVQLTWAEFEVVETRLAVRVTRLV